MPREYVLQSFRSPTDLQIDYAGELNEQQQKAVVAPPGPALVIAGAGSGKTRTLTYRVAFLLEQGIPSDRILLLTFTNKAAKEMMRRVKDLLGTELSNLWGGTFHSVGARILRRHAELLGYRPDFTIIDRQDANDLVKTCMAAADIDVKATRFPKAEVLAEIFSMAANRLKPVATVLRLEYEHFSHLGSQIEDVHRRYLERKRAANVMDFDDLLVLWFRLLKEQSALREQYQRKFQFILVDEYQDTNQLQSDLIDLLAERHRNVMVVGDDSQSIYSWRGANFQNILQFPKRYPEAEIYKIEVNYRSTPEILAVANAAIASNQEQFVKRLTPARKSGPKPVVVTCGDGSEQAAFIAQRILQLREEGMDINRMAVLYRSHFHALELQLELTRRNIPFSITSGIRFFEQAHIKDVTAYLKLVANPNDELSFKRLVQLLPGIGGKGADKLWQCFAAQLPVLGLDSKPQVRATTPDPMIQGTDLEDETPHDSGSSDLPQPLATALAACSSIVSTKSEVAWAEFTVALSQLEAKSLRRQPARMIRLVLEAGYEEYVKENFANYRNRLEDLEQLANFALQFPNTTEFLTQLSLLTNLEADDERPASNDTEQIRLSTVHQAKGLEFDVVFILMLCDGLFPSARSLNSAEGEEEERRLFYVALTRARQELYLSYPLIRLTQGPSGDIMQQRSRFLGEIPPELYEQWNLRPFDPYR